MYNATEKHFILGEKQVKFYKHSMYECHRSVVSLTPREVK